MRATILAAAIVLSVPAFAEAPGITAFTIGQRYAKRFPVNEVSAAELIAALGPPERQFEFEGQSMWSYAYGEPGWVGTYTFTVVDGTVIRVQYVNEKGARGSSD